MITCSTFTIPRFFFFFWFSQIYIGLGSVTIKNRDIVKNILLYSQTFFFSSLFKFSNLKIKRVNGKTIHRLFFFFFLFSQI